MKAWFKSCVRWWAALVIAATAAVWWGGCDDGDGGRPPPADEQPPPDDEETSYDLTGLWRMKNSQATYSLRQRGRSLQGRFYDTSDPTVHGDIAGVVDGDEVALYVAVTFDTHPEDNFVARKEGVIRNRDHMTLVVTGGPKYVGQVQEWYRL